jgi:hypothetical protein
MRQKIARMIHHVDRRLAIFNPNVHVQPKNQVGPGDQLQILNNILVARVGMNLLGTPVRERMRRHRRDPQPVFPSQSDNASRIMFRRNNFTSVLASLMLLQIPVPTSTTDWCISAFTRS